MKPLLYLDTETTALSAPRLVEIALLTANGCAISFRVRPPVPIEPGASAVNGIVDSDVAHLPPFKEHVLYHLVKRMVEESTVVAHNAPFDIGVLESEGILVNDSVDTKEMAKKRFPGMKSYSLQNLRYELFLDNGVEEGLGRGHTAASDVRVLKALYKRICTEEKLKK